MQKDVIYIDVDDDITAIIDKVKSSSHKIIALVPPKRTGVLQSAVNLRLINRAATQKDKRLVVITNDAALAGLAAAAAIPVAKNLQSKPELAEIAALSVDDDDDIIDGAELPIGDHARLATGADPAEASQVASAGLATAGETRKAEPTIAGKSLKNRSKRGQAVPNFDKFRKKMVLVVAGVLLLIGLIVWAIFFAPQATINVTTRTTDVAISQQVTLDSDAETSATSNVIAATTKSQSDDVAIDFKATGKKNVGEKATGTVKFENNSLTSKTVEAGTRLQSSSGLEYLTDSSVTVPGASLGDCGGGTACIVTGSANVSVTAAERGEKYNGATGAVSGQPNGLDGSFTDATSGGTDKTVAVVASSDMARAKSEAEDAIAREKMTAELKKQLGDKYIVLEDSLQVDTSKLKSSVPVGDEAPGGEAVYGGAITYRLYAVAIDELDDYLKAVIEQQIDDPKTQKVYESGAKQVKFTNVDKSDSGLQASLSTNGKIGPQIDEAKVKQQSAGKRIGDIKSAIESINGVDSVDVRLSPFWVSKAPKNIEKIRVEFTLDDQS